MKVSDLPPLALAWLRDARAAASLLRSRFLPVPEEEEEEEGHSGVIPLPRPPGACCFWTQNVPCLPVNAAALPCPAFTAAGSCTA